jgi:cbb3-type cytochrome oxidase subunit 3
MLGDAIGTLIVTRGRTAGWRPTRLWYAVTWRVTRGTAARLPPAGGDFVLNVYPACSLLGLLVLWLVGLVVGWASVYWSLREAPGGAGDWGTILYYSGTSLLTPAFGTAHGTLVRMLTLIETLTGLGTIALLISYLPALYSAYSRREARLLTLDDPQGVRIMPARVIAVHAGGSDLVRLYRFFADWEAWTAEVLESHISYPMLALFRSQHPGQSWVTALGVVTDSATLTCACIEGAELREPYFMYCRGRRAVLDIAARMNLPPSEMREAWLTRERMDIAWAQLEDLGVPLRDRDEAWQRLQDLRAPYGGRLEQLIDFLLAPRGFWGHSAEVTVDEDISRAITEARQRGKRPPRRS